MPFSRLVTPRLLTEPDAAGVRTLQRLTARADGVSALSEQTMLLASPGSAPAFHAMGYAGELLVGYAQLTGGARWGGGEPSGELVVAPAERRKGWGTQLWEALAGEDGDVRVWAHGSLPSARGFAASLGLVAVRELHKMARPLTAEDIVPPDLPAGLRARAFVPGRDEDAWLSANAEAFADHPEQGRLGRGDLDARMSQPWFDPAGFILVEHEDQPGTVAAFHWTKVEAGVEAGAAAETDAGVEAGVEAGAEAGAKAGEEPDEGGAEGGREASRPVGEVYAVGVRPAYRGRGLAGPLTRLGLSHLAAQGLRQAVLYVDGDNAAALATYRRAGFRSIMVDVMYSRGVHHPLSG